MRLRALCLALCLVGFGGAFTTNARAQATTETAGTADARELFRRGEAAYSAGNYELAIREWNNAYAIDPRPRIQFNLSQAYERLGQLEKAMEALKIFLDSGSPDDPMYPDANARLAALQQRLANTGVVVVGGREGGAIMVDDKDWGRTPRPDRIPVSPGSHVLVVRWPDRPEFRTNLSVPAGQVIEVVLPEDTGAAAPTSPTTGTGAVIKVEKKRRVNPVVYYAVGGGLAAAGAGLITYGAVRSTADSDCGGNTWCHPDDVGAVERQTLAGYVTGGLVLAGGAALILVGYFKSRDREEPKSAARTTCGVGLTSATCRIRF